MTKKDICTFILALLFAGSIIYSNKYEVDNLETCFEDTVTSSHLKLLHSVDSINYLIKGFQTENIRLHLLSQRLFQERNNLKSIQQQIINQYKNIYEKISTSNDTLQYGIQQDLLAKHRSTKLERN